jgi:HAD superfamily hydrolase (TIGR01509 family)
MDSMDCHCRAWQKVFRSQGREVAREFILQNEGVSDVRFLMKNIFAQDLGEAGDDSPQMEEARQFLKKLGQQQRKIFLSRYLHKVKPYPGALPLIQFLRQRQIPCALVSSSSRLTIANIVPGYLQQLLAAVIGAEDVSRQKPDPEPYLAAAGSLRVSPGGCLAVENSPGGIRSAIAAGTVCVAVSTTLAPEMLAQASRVFPSLEALNSGLEQLQDFFHNS